MRLRLRRQRRSIILSPTLLDATLKTREQALERPGELAAESRALLWLTASGRSARALGFGAVLCGTAQALATLFLMYELARVLHALVLEHSLAGVPPGACWRIPLWVVLRALLGLARDEFGLRAGRSARLSLRQELLEAIRRGGPLWSARLPGGALSSVLSDQVEAVDGYFAHYRPQQMLAAIVPLLILAAVLPYSWMAALILLGTAPLVPVFMILVGWRTRAEQSRQMLAMQRLGGTFLDLLRGLPTLRLFDARQRSLEELSALGESFCERTMKVLRLAFLNGAVLEFFTSISIALSAVFLGFSLLGYLKFGFYGAGPKLESALFILLLAPEFYQPLRQLGSHYHARAEALAAAMNIRQVLATLPEGAGGQSGASPGGSGPAALEFAGVHLAYRAGEPVLTDCSLALAPGECVAVLGPSGAGKSSLLRLAAGIALPGAGELRVDGVPLAELDLQAWREQIGWMDQHPPLLAASLASNLQAACARAVAPEALWDALDFAGLGDWARALPEGLATRMGEGGRWISGGQLRRLALARLALRRPRLLLLDEPTASLDAGAEAFMVARLEKLAAGCTTLLVSHRPAPLTLAGRVLELGPGGLRPLPAAALAALLQAGRKESRDA